MRPKEKALNLINQFKENDYDWIAQGNNSVVIKSSLIVVNEILNARTVGKTGVVLDKEYWEEVRDELNAL